ncbi:MAG: hypothetical protein ABMB14_41080 [Myxococcota bacterium]
MIRRLLVIAPIVAGGCEAQLCALLGEYAGQYEGDLSGEVNAAIADAGGGEADVHLELHSGEGDDATALFGDSKVSCDDGELTLDLSAADGEAIGTVTGLLEGGAGHGDWSLLSGETGTWSY